MSFLGLRYTLERPFGHQNPLKIESLSQIGDSIESKKVNPEIKLRITELRNQEFYESKSMIEN